MRDGDIINGLVKGLSVIECFDEEHASQSITDVANGRASNGRRPDGAC